MNSAKSRGLHSQSVPLFNRARTIQLTLSGTALIATSYGLARFAYGLFLPHFRSAFDMSGSLAGGIASGSYLAYCVGVIVSTLLTPRLGAKALAASSGVLAAAGMLLVTVAPNAWVLALGVIVAGSSTGVASPPLAHAVSYRVTHTAKDRVQTIVNAGTGAGVMISGPVALIAGDQWRVAWCAFSVIAVLVTIWVGCAVPAQPRISSAGRSSDDAWLKKILPRGVGRLIVASALMGAASAATWTFGQELLFTVAGHERTAATIAWIALGACGIVGGGVGELIRRLGYRPSWIMLMGALFASSLILAIACTSYPLALLALSVFGIVYIALTGLLLVWSTAIYGDSPAFGVGLSFLLIAVGQSISSPLLGAINDTFDMTHTFWVAAVLALIGSAAMPREV